MERNEIVDEEVKMIPERGLANEQLSPNRQSLYRGKYLLILWIVVVVAMFGLIRSYARKNAEDKSNFPAKIDGQHLQKPTVDAEYKKYEPGEQSNAITPHQMEEQQKGEQKPVEEPQPESSPEGVVEMIEEQKIEKHNPPEYESEVKTFPREGRLEDPGLLELSEFPRVKQHIKNAIEAEYPSIYSQNLVNLYKELSRHPENTFLHQVQFYFYHMKEGIGRNRPEAHMCIVAAGRNLVENDDYAKFVHSIARQNYTNYSLVITDDASTDGTFDALVQVVKETPLLHGRTTLIHNLHQVGALANKDIMIRNYCQKGDIVIDIDADDFLLGRQVLKLFNILYYRTGKWVIYSNYIYYFNEGDKYAKGLSAKIRPGEWQYNNYRRDADYWATGHLQTYLRDLYVKIPYSYLLEDGEHFYLWASDRFIMYALIEMAGADHSDFVEYYPYYYNRVPSNRDECGWAPMEYDEYKARTLTPLLPLGSLQEAAKVTKGFRVPDKVKGKLEEKKRMYEACYQS